MLPTARIVHQTPGRLRIRVEARRGDGGYFLHADRQLSMCTGIAHIDVNPVTASILLFHAVNLDVIARYGEREGVFRLAVVAQPPISARRRIHDNLEDVNRNLQLISAGQLDLGGMLTIGLVAMAIHQALKGNVMAPAATLLWYALNGLRMPAASAPSDP